MNCWSVNTFLCAFGIPNQAVLQQGRNFLLAAPLKRITQQVNLRKWPNSLSNDFMNKKQRQDNQKLTVTQWQRSDEKRWIGQEHATKSVLGFYVTDHYLRIKTLIPYQSTYKLKGYFVSCVKTVGFKMKNKFKRVTFQATMWRWNYKILQKDKRTLKRCYTRKATVIRSFCYLESC